MVFNLEQIAEANELVIVDTNVLASFANSYKFRTFILDDKDLVGLEGKLEIIKNMLILLRNNKNLVNTLGTYEELKEGRIYTDRHERFQKRSVKKIESFSRNSSFSRGNVDYTNKVDKVIREINEHFRRLHELTKNRILEEERTCFNPLLQMVFSCARNIYSFHPNIKFLLGNQKDKDTDEKIVAHAFAYTLSGKGQIAIATCDKRIPALADSLYSLLAHFSRVCRKPEIISTLDNFPIRVYQGDPKRLIFEKKQVYISRTLDKGNYSKYCRVIAETLPSFMSLPLANQTQMY